MDADCFLSGDVGEKGGAKWSLRALKSSAVGPEVEDVLSGFSVLEAESIPPALGSLSSRSGHHFKQELAKEKKKGKEKGKTDHYTITRR